MIKKKYQVMVPVTITIYSPEYLEEALQDLRKNPPYVGYYCGGYAIEAGRRIKVTEVPNV